MKWLAWIARRLGTSRVRAAALLVALCLPASGCEETGYRAVRVDAGGYWYQCSGCVATWPPTSPVQTATHSCYCRPGEICNYFGGSCPDLGVPPADEGLWPDANFDAGSDAAAADATVLDAAIIDASTIDAQTDQGTTPDQGTDAGTGTWLPCCGGFGSSPVRTDYYACFCPPGAFCNFQQCDSGPPPRPPDLGVPIDAGLDAAD